MEKIKQLLLSEKGKDILTVIIVILVGLASFGLGRLSKGGSSTGIQIEYPVQQEANAISSTENLSRVTLDTKATSSPLGKVYFASNRGSKYYSIGCSGGKTIKQENRVYFATAEEAERAGYELSSTCR